MIFKLTAQHTDGGSATFTYDNQLNELRSEDGKLFTYGNTIPSNRLKSTRFSKNEPINKSSQVRVLKIQLGLSCNYSCEYCSQRFVEKAPETSKKDITAFMQKLEHLSFSEEGGLKIEFWGGEPLVYIKTMMPLFDALQQKFKGWNTPPRYSIITNGSILTDEICDWLFDNGLSVGLSHDGPGQAVRGPDPFEDPEQKTRILKFFSRMKGRMSFNAMLNRANTSRKAIQDWFIAMTGDDLVPIGEGGIVDAYDEGGTGMSLNTKAEHFTFRKQAFNDIREYGAALGFAGILDKIDRFTSDVLSHQSAAFVGQKCGMDASDTLAVDLRGDIITCQNTSAVEIAPNGEPHLSGNLVDMDAVRITTATHWSNRPHCSECPVLHICRGSCMFLEGDLWTTSCANAYSDAIALFSLSFEAMTGHIPVSIEGGALPPERSDIWGVLQEHKETKRKVIPITPTTN